jgi:hypothetical protein
MFFDFSTSHCGIYYPHDNIIILKTTNIPNICVCVVCVCVYKVLIFIIRCVCFFQQKLFYRLKNWR